MLRQISNSAYDFNKRSNKEKGVFPPGGVAWCHLLPCYFQIPQPTQHITARSKKLTDVQNSALTVYVSIISCFHPDSSGFQTMFYKDLVVASQVFSRISHRKQTSMRDNDPELLRIPGMHNSSQSMLCVLEGTFSIQKGQQWGLRGLHAALHGQRLEHFPDFSVAWRGSVADTRVLPCQSNRCEKIPWRLNYVNISSWPIQTW